MKTKVTHGLLILFLFVSGSTYAQITFNQSDYPVPGEIWAELSDSRTGVHTIPGAGASQNWNYSSAFIVDDTTVLGFILPSSTPLAWASNFPNATMALWDVSNNAATYLRSASNGIFLDGGYDASGGQPVTVLDLNPDQLILPAPFTYNGTRNHNALFTVEQPAQLPNPGVLIKLYFIQNFTCNAYGTINTPIAVNASVLRIRDFTYTIDSTFLDAAGTGNYTFFNSNGPADTSITHYFVKKGPNAIVMEIDEDPATPGNSIGARYYQPGLVGLPENNELQEQVSLFPNPSYGEIITIQVDFEGAEQLRICDVDGKVVRQESIKGISTYLMNSSAFARGIYFYELSGPSIPPVRNRFVIQ